MIRRLFSNRDYIRNFCIIAHVDHGKSTLADRFLELTGTKINKSQVLDKLAVERERGITVRAQSVTMDYTYKGQKYLLNLIDTPGHVDFSYEVSRSLRACQGAILLVDAISGIQAQTYSTYYQAKEAGLTIIPAINKIDHPSASPEHIFDQVKTHFGLGDQHFVSAMTGKGVPELLDSLVQKFPKPHGDDNKPFRGFLFDSWFDKHKGVICLIEVVDGILKKNDKIVSFQTKKVYEVAHLGFYRLDLEYKDVLEGGQVGFIVLNMKETSEALIGDTFHLLDSDNIAEFEGFKKPKCMVYAGVYPEDPEEYDELNNCIKKYQLEDRSLLVQRDLSTALGNGFRCGFLGMLHMDIFQERLDREHQIEVVITSPSVPYMINLKDGTDFYVENPNEIPDRFKIKSYMEPIASVTIFIPSDHIGDIIKYCMQKRGIQEDLIILDSKSTIVKFSMPLAEIITDFYSNLKSMTKGMATLDYEHSEYKISDLGILTVLLNGEKVDALTSMVPREQAYDRGKAVTSKLKEYLPGQLFEVAIQAAFNGKVIARDTIKAYRKDVTAKLYGGDQTRRDKLLEKQKKGKKKMKLIGNVKVDSNTFQKILKNE
jgi:elongation factor 4